MVVDIGGLLLVYVILWLYYSFGEDLVFFEVMVVLYLYKIRVLLIC